MKLITICLLLLAAQANAGWFDNTEEQLHQANQELQAQRQSTGGWQLVAGTLAVVCVTLLVVGAAIGSKARREVKRGDE